MVEGAYSLICMTPKRMVACRDPLGIRPLVMGRIGDATVFASESVALDIVGAEFVREVEPGELVEVRIDGRITSHRPFGDHSPRPCIFEHVYFSRPDSVMGGRSVYDVRKRIGIELAKEAPAEADLIVPVPDSGVPAAIGYAQQSGIPFELGIIRSHYVGRTFIQPSDGARHADVKRKHNANRAIVEGKRIVLIDDSIVRGTTSMKIVQMMRDAGAAEVHMRIASPPTEHSCFYGVDTRNVRSCSPRGWMSPAWRSSFRLTVLALFPSTAFTAPWANPRATMLVRSTAMPVSPASIPRP